ncbi:hypothetical protein D3C84_386880 [compost metagenome]
MQHHVQAAQARVVTDLGGQAIAIHFRHFRIGEDHQQFFGHVHAGISPGLEHVQGLQPVAGNMHLHAQLSQGIAQLRQGHVRVIHQQHLTATGTFQHRIFELVAGDLGVVRDDFGQDLFDVDDFHQLIIDLADGRQVVLAAGAARGRQDGFPVHVDDPVHATDQEGLNRTVVFGDDNRAARPRHQRAHANGLGQVDHRQGLATQVDHAAHKRMALRHQRQLWQLQDFLHFKDVDREQLPSGEPEHENFQAILTHQLRALVYRVENAGHQ